VLCFAFRTDNWGPPVDIKVSCNLVASVCFVRIVWDGLSKVVLCGGCCRPHEVADGEMLLFLLFPVGGVVVGIYMIY
jgi:hypothetical protein